MKRPCQDADDGGCEGDIKVKKPDGAAAVFGWFHQIGHDFMRGQMTLIEDVAAFIGDLSKEVLEGMIALMMDLRIESIPLLLF